MSAQGLAPRKRAAVNSVHRRLWEGPMFKRQVWVTAVCLAFLGAGACGQKEKSVSVPVAEGPAGQAQALDPDAALLAMADRHARAFLTTAPESATELGVSEEIAGAGYLARLGEYDFDAHQAARQMNETFLQELKLHDRAKLTGVAATTYDVLKNAYDVAARRNQFDFGGASPSAFDPIGCCDINMRGNARCGPVSCVMK
jgi:hypothetical protein